MDEAVNVPGKALIIFLLAGFVPSIVGQSLHEVGKTFVWRINPSDYFFAEARFGRWFSHSNDVVFALIDSAGDPSHAVALVRQSNESYRISLYDFPNPKQRSAASEMRLRTAVLDAIIGRKIETAVRFRLRRLVLLDPQPKNPRGRQFGAWWIFHRDAANKVDTAFIDRNAGHANAQASAFLNGIIWNLERYVEGDEHERTAFATLLDDAAAKIAKGELPDRY